MFEPLGEAFYKRDALIVAKELLGKTLIRRIDKKIYCYKIVETEAYRGAEDRGCHAYNNKCTERTKPMFESGGITYIYLIYGMYNCLNIVTENRDVPHAVLIRAVAPLDLESVALAKENRKIKSKKLGDLTNGPGKLCKALQIDKTLNCISVTEQGPLWIAEGETIEKIIECPRINIPYALEYEGVPWRFYIEDNSYVSIKFKAER